MAMEKQQFEDVSPIKHGDFPFFILVCREVYSNIWMCVCVLYDGVSCTVTLQKHSHPWSPWLKKKRGKQSSIHKKTRTHSGHSRTPLIPYHHPLVFSFHLSFFTNKKNTPSSTLTTHPHPIGTLRIPFGKIGGNLREPPPLQPPPLPTPIPSSLHPRYSLAVSIILTAPMVLEEAAVPWVHPQFHEFILEEKLVHNYPPGKWHILPLEPWMC